jgi:hypothetical protein
MRHGVEVELAGALLQQTGEGVDVTFRKAEGDLFPRGAFGKDEFVGKNDGDGAGTEGFEEAIAGGADAAGAEGKAAAREDAEVIQPGFGVARIAVVIVGCLANERLGRMLDLIERGAGG